MKKRLIVLPLSALVILQLNAGEIRGDGVSADGVVDYSEAKELSFFYEDDDPLSEIRWVYEVKMDGGGYYEVASSSSSNFSFVLPELFDIVSEGRDDLSGDIESRVRLNAVIGGVAKELLCPVWVRGGRLVEMTGVEQQTDNPDCCNVSFRFYTSQPGRFIRYFATLGLGGVVENLGLLDAGVQEFTVESVYYDLDYNLSLSRRTADVLEYSMDIPIRIDSKSGVNELVFSSQVEYMSETHKLNILGSSVLLYVYSMSGMAVKEISYSGTVDLKELPKGLYIVYGTVDGKVINFKIIK